MFRFAIITDTHIRPPEGDESSPFSVNEMANDRARYAVELIRQYEPSFTVHLGDMVHPLPHLPSYDSAAEEALKILKPLSERLYFVPGNHDIGDKPMASSPAGGFTDENGEIYSRHFGSSKWHFEQEKCHFISINSSIINSKTDHEIQQTNWLESKLSECTGDRIFLFTHYPPFINQTDEPSHYDNYAEPGRRWLINLIKKFDVEAVFSGHTHQFFFNRINSCKLYTLPPTSFTRQDYAELYRISPTPEFGRNDTGKFCVTIVDVAHLDHTINLIPTNGNLLKSNEQSEIRVPIPVKHSLNVHLRHAWAESVDLPYNGPMEEFSRKRARNDYVVARLWQMGIETVRIPIDDLLDPGIRSRIEDFAATGVSFSFFSLTYPDQETIDLLNRFGSVISGLEIVSATSEIDSILVELTERTQSVSFPIYVGKSHSSAHELKKGSNFAHAVSSGFLWSERDKLITALRQFEQANFSGFVFQLNLEDDIDSRLAEIQQFCDANKIKAIANVRLAHKNPAQENFDDEFIVERVSIAAKHSNLLAKVTVQLDTFIDIDRGYNPRHGLLDRHLNFQPAGAFLAGT